MIYILEDDASIRNLVIYALQNSEGLEVRGFERPSKFWEAIKKETPQLVLLDIMLPEEDGLTVLSKLRESPATADTYVIMLTARNTTYDKVVGLDSGADDYIAKPFEIIELISRVKVALRHSEHTVNNRPSEITEHNYKGIYLSTDKHIVKIGEEQISLTMKEFEILTLLLQNMGKVLSRDDILRQIWGYEFDGENRTVDVHVRGLRSKLGKYGKLVETVRGIGYKMGE